MSVHKETRLINRKANLLIPFDPKKMAEQYQRMLEAVSGPSMTIRPHAGVNVPKKSAKRANNSGAVSEATAAPGDGEGSSAGDDDGGDGEGDSDGPRRASHPRRRATKSSLRAHRRSLPSRFLLPGACVFLTTLALSLFPYYQLGLAAYLADRGHVQLASEVLKYQPPRLFGQLPTRK